MRTLFDTGARDTQTATFLAGVLCGLATGAALGLTLAPKSGREVRRQIADTSGTMRQRATDAGRAARARIGREARAVASAVTTALHGERQPSGTSDADLSDAGRSAFGGMAVR